MCSSDLVIAPPRKFGDLFVRINPRYRNHLIRGTQSPHFTRIEPRRECGNGQGLFLHIMQCQIPDKALPNGIHARRTEEAVDIAQDVFFLFAFSTMRGMDGGT